MLVKGQSRFTAKKGISTLIMLSLVSCLFQFESQANGAPVTTSNKIESSVVNGKAGTIDINKQDPPTVGWNQVEPIKYHIQKPWNLALDQRYKYDAKSNTHTMWVKSTDEPFQKGNTTEPRTEMRWHHEYATGEHMWEADVNIASGSAGSSVVQILRVDRPAGTHASDIMLVVHEDNTVKRYRSPNGALIKSNVYDKWWNLKVAHNANTGVIKVYADDKLVLTEKDRGPATRHFKNGVYGVKGTSQIKFRDIKYWVK
ncbi:polysaccharide lyase family 7 protein [Paenibacillus sp. 481]|uniref:polysaccharide lyase family 7 protein n=1 Tax=Paenibacillus sp. 481 TaxID=2835869 RepID=UPI001E37A10F|nr:polysaccharide lyase family 7 protein [Paenibacillus sp. 481]UHA73431.1 hypothetical protein KIK04_23200 [Paenibacillus sp. 481]